MSKTDKFDLFLKLMMMTTSDVDGEALVALRKANAMLAEQNMNWEELLKAKVKFARQERSEEYHQRKRGERNRHDSTNGEFVMPSDEEINLFFEILLDSVHPKAPFREFVESVHSFWEENGYLTKRQAEAIKKAAERQ